MYTNQLVSDESTLRKSYVFQCYQETIDKIRSFVENKKIWMTLDKTTDNKGNLVANLVVKNLELNCPTKNFLINTEVLKRWIIVQFPNFFNRSLKIIWSNGIKHDCVLLLLNDAAPYIIKAGKTTKVFYSKTEHVTCLPHALHRIAEEVRKYFPKVGQLISNCKKNIFEGSFKKRVF